MPPADCIHLVQRRNITHFLIKTVCLSGNIRQKEDFTDCWYSNILACSVLTVCDICEVGGMCIQGIGFVQHNLCHE